MRGYALYNGNDRFRTGSQADKETLRIAPLKEQLRDLISVTEASQLSGFTPDHIRKLIRKREIDGIKIGRNWLTTREAIRKYLKTERRPGPKPQKRTRR